MLDSLSRPRRGDVALAGALLIASGVEVLVVHDSNGRPGLLMLVSLLATAGLLWRRDLPAVAVAGSAAGLLIPIVLDSEADNAALLVANLVAMHAVNAYGSRRTAVVGSGVLLAAVWASIHFSSSRTAGDIEWAFLLYALAAGAGQLMNRQARANRVALLAAERAAIAQERRSVAADLHDVIAHGLALMVVQAGAAATVLQSDPARAKELLDGVQDTGERAAAELHHLLTVLAPDGEPLTPGPTPGLADLGSLAESVASGGAALDLDVVGDPTRVPEALSHAGYRIVQESLTNAIKHAPGSSITASVVIASDLLEVRVENSGGSGPYPQLPPSGHGLAAMRERAALFGGTLDGGPTAHGWTTHARFPLAQDGSRLS